MMLVLNTCLLIATKKAKACRRIMSKRSNGFARPLNKISPAQYDLGLCYYNGQGVRKDYGEALKWFHKAAEQNFAPAQFILGTCSDKGEGVPKDNVEAVKFYRKAAE